MSGSGWWQNQLITLAGVGLAMLLGAIIGLEREFKDKPAGLRTHMLTAGSATLLVHLGRAMVRQLASAFQGSFNPAEQLRIISAVVTGVTFLGAGTIIRRSEGRHVEGLTTAASLLFTAVVGIAVALSQWVVAVGGTLLALLTLTVVNWFEEWLDRRRQ
jgi:putative Mg2+ transporter-C (MgtC) family protein